jgi:hypothetical protein
MPGRGKGFLSSLRPERLWGSPVLLSNAHRKRFPRVKRPEREADRSFLSNALELYLHTLYDFMALRLIKHRDKFTFLTSFGVHLANYPVGTGSKAAGTWSRPLTSV